VAFPAIENVTISGNYIGTTADGKGKLGNSVGVLVTGQSEFCFDGCFTTESAANVPNTTIGTLDDGTGSGNVISGNRTGVLIERGAHAFVLSNYVGTDESGMAAVGNATGVHIVNSPDTVIFGSDAAPSVISGNTTGVLIEGEKSRENELLGNLIGTNREGTARLHDNQSNRWGVAIRNGASKNSVGVGPGNVISGNLEVGVDIAGAGTEENEVHGNLIGTDKSGTARLHGDTSNRFGVAIRDGAAKNVVGGTLDDVTRNIISGNLEAGVQIQGAGTTGNKILGNYIGTNEGGIARLSNDVSNDFGVVIGFGASGNIVGGSVEAARNVISGNATAGVRIQNPETAENQIVGNYIGTNADGLRGLLRHIPLPPLDKDEIENSIIINDADNGIVIASGATNNVVGGSQDGERNIITANLENGVLITGPDTTGNRVLGNYIGTTATGRALLDDAFLEKRRGVRGVAIANAPGNFIGGFLEEGELVSNPNVISGHRHQGILIAGPDAKDNSVLGNYIGTDPAANTSFLGGLLGNGKSGILIKELAADNLIGGLLADDGSIQWVLGNVVSGNLVGIGVDGSDGNVVIGNRVGTDIHGDRVLRNSVGIVISEGQRNRIGGQSDTPASCDGQCNLISGNSDPDGQLGQGIVIQKGAEENRVLGNFIGTDVSGQRAIPNANTGITILGSNKNIIGEPGVGNLISGNAASQGDQPSANIYITASAGADGIGRSADENKVQANFIGTNAAGDARIGGQTELYGVRVVGSSGNRIGTPGAGNLIAGHRQNIRIEGLLPSFPSAGNTVQANKVGTNLRDEHPFGNFGSDQRVGIAAIFVSGGTQIGGKLGEEGNVVAGHSIVGIAVASSVEVAVQGNLVGLAEAGNQAGVRILDSSFTRVGGSPELRNIISGNVRHGLELWISHQNIIRHNYIGTDQEGSSAVGNGSSISEAGVSLTESSHNEIDDNLISGNAGPGIRITTGPEIAGILATGNRIRRNRIGTAADAASSLPNGGDGVRITGARSAGNVIGGPADDNNIIAFNKGHGVVRHTPTEIDARGIHFNEKDPQIFPSSIQGLQYEITNTSQHNSTIIEGVIQGSANTEHRLDFFVNSACTPGFGHGEQFFATRTVTTDANGRIDFRAVFDETLPVGTLISTTITTDEFGTTGFSPCGAVTPPIPQDQISVDDAFIPEGDNGVTLAEVTLIRRNVSDQTVTVQVATADGTARAADGDYTAVSGLLVTFPPGVIRQTVGIEVAGNEVSEPDRMFDVLLSNPGGGAVIGRDTATVTILDDDSTSISIGDALVLEPDEGTTPMEFTVSMSGPIGRPVTVEVNTADGTATVADGDYTPISGLVLTFNPGEPLTQTVTVDVHGDTTVEADETLTVTLSNPTGANVTLQRAVGQGVILNDAAATISIRDASATEADDSVTAMEFVVSLSNPSDTPVTVQLNTADGTATAASGDYTPISGLVLTFQPGEPLSQVVTVDVLPDTTVEPVETFTVHLSNATGTSVAIVDGTGLGAIFDDDATEISVTGPSMPEGTGGTTPFELVIELTSPSAESITVDLSTQDGTATAADGDYRPVAGRVITIPPGELQVVTHVDVIADDKAEGDEQFFVRLTNATGRNVSIASPLTTVTIENDDTPAYSIDDVALAESDDGATAFQFTVSLSNPADQPLSVRIDTSDGVGVHAARAADGDYEPITNLVWNYQPGDPLTFPVTVNVAGNLATQPDRTFRVILSEPSPPSVIADPVGLGTIIDDDADNDGDGVSDKLEDLAPGGGDANGDGTPDRQQPHVAALPNAVDGRYVALVASPGAVLSGVRPVANPDPANSPPGITFPLGFFEFSVTGISPGDAAAVTMHLPPGIAPETFYSYGRQSPSDPADRFYEFLFDGTTGGDIVVERVHLVDGSRGDNDVTVDGVISGLAAPGLITGTDLSLTVTGLPEVGQNQPLQYTLTVANDGPNTATEVRLASTLPADATFVAAASSQGTVTEANGVLTFQLDTLPVGVAVTAIIDVLAPPDPGVAVHTASVVVSQGDLDASNNVAVQETLVKVVGIISGQKFQDDNGNGQRDPREIGLNGFTIELVDAEADEVVMTTTTRPIDLNGDGVIDPETERGRYEFAVLVGGTYEVREQSMPGFTQTFPVGGDSRGGGQLFADRLYPAGSRPVALAIGDLDDDGHPDVVTANEEGFGVSVLLNNGDGTLAERTDYTDNVLFERPSDVQLGDVNNDGFLDIVVANNKAGTSATVVVLLGHGDGTFGEPRAYVLDPPAEKIGSESKATKVVLGEVNNDNRIDIIAAVEGRGDGLVAVLLNTGADADRFAAPVHLNALERPNDVSVDDLDGDGNLDIVVLDGQAGGGAQILLGAGDGSFAPMMFFQLSFPGLSEGPPLALAIGDMNNDDVPDLVAAVDGASTFISSRVVVALGNGDGTFALRARVSLVPAAGEPRDLILKEMDGDGDLDVILTYGDTNPFDGQSRNDELLVLSGTGEGLLHAPVRWNKGVDAVSLAGVDMDEDGHLDVVMVHRADARVYVLLADADGGFGRTDVPLAGDIEAVALGDLNHDGRLDIVTGVNVRDASGSPAGAKISALLGSGEGEFAGPIDLELSLPSHVRSVSFAGFRLGDVDDDGHLDLLFVGNDGFQIVQGVGRTRFLALARGQGDGTFAEPEYLSASFFISDIGGVALTDVNGDGHLDVAVSHGISNALLPRDLTVYFGQGTGDFREPVSYFVDISSGARPFRIDDGDIDNDGDVDFVGAGGGQLIAVKQRDMDLQGSLAFDAGAGEFHIEGTRYFDDQVLVTADPSGTVTVEMRWLDAEGAPHTLIESSHGVPVSSIVFEHGFGDFQVDNQTGQTVELVPPFLRETYVAGEDNDAVPLLGDLDGDGNLDAVVLIDRNDSSEANHVSVLLNDGDGAFGAATLYAVGRGDIDSSKQQISLADVNGDDVLDLLATNSDARGSRMVTVWLGIGDGRFDSRADFALLPANGIALGDLDANGDLDLVAAIRQSTGDALDFDQPAGLSIRFNPFQPGQESSEPVHTVSIVPGETVSGRDFGNRGEFEFDFGDAPDSYGTLLADDGARHAVGGPLLGSQVEPDSDGQPNDTATGDDNDGIDDEDGVTFTSLLVQGQSATVTVHASGELQLDAWIDFNGNGVFEHPAEQVFASRLAGARRQRTRIRSCHRRPCPARRSPASAPAPRAACRQPARRPMEKWKTTASGSSHRSIWRSLSPTGSIRLSR
jgi:uncharacterized repeat protein (TIGR01451 family)